MTRIGVLDVGTNSVRVLVADVRAGAIEREHARDLTITRLGEGVDHTRVLGAEPLRRTVDVVARYVEQCRALEIDHIRLIATSAVRDAANRKEFVDAVRSRTGVDVELLSGDDEAKLAFRGATADIEPQPFLVVDIGGGSTEFVRGARQVERFVSMDIGSVRLTERHVTSDPPDGDQIAALRADAAREIASAARIVGEEPAMLVGVAGTVTTVTAIAHHLSGFDRDAIHHARLTRAELTRTVTQLCGMTSAQRRELPAMPPGREDVIAAGAVILDEIFERFSAADALVSVSDILDGAALTATHEGTSRVRGEP